MLRNEAMKMNLITASYLVLSLLAPGIAAGQVLWDLDFDSLDLLGQWPSSIWNGSAPPVVTFATVDGGQPLQGHALRVSVDSSQMTNNWYGAWQGWPVASPGVSYDPIHTFLSFDLLVSDLKPVHVKLYYNSVPQNTRNLEIDVNPTVVDSFQHFLIPLSAFSVTFFFFDPPAYPTTVEFGIRGRPAMPDTTWGFASNNVFMLDNIIYSIAPALSITASDTT